MKRFGFNWNFNCSSFPSKAKNEMCMDNNMFKEPSAGGAVRPSAGGAVRPSGGEVTVLGKKGKREEKTRTKKGELFKSFSCLSLVTHFL